MEAREASDGDAGGKEPRQSTVEPPPETLQWQLRQGDPHPSSQAERTQKPS
ncbi:hypothetical protein PI124_g19215 [Phytophthora idaei]|nr:hypothetical protein PI124_g19215 [Phytophthora idaei]